MKKVVFVLAQKDFRDEEYFETRASLDSKGIFSSVASLVKGVCTSKEKKQVNSQFNLAEVDINEFEAIIFVGGIGASDYFFNDEAHHLAQKFLAQNKFVCAICIAPRILAEAGILHNKTVTSYESVAESIKSKGGNWTGKNVEVDEKIITANGPESSWQFGETISQRILDEQ